MKQLFCSCRNHFFAVCIVVAGFLAALSCHAGLNIPYSVDADTMHLWHMNDPLTSGTEADVVTNSPIVLTNFGYPTSGPPFTNVFLTDVTVAPGIVEAFDILPNDGNPGNAASHAMAAGPEDMNPTNFCNATTGAFTFEALVNPQGNIFNGSAGSGEWEILCGDNSVGTRSWQFRLQNENSPTTPPEINFNFINAANGSSLSTTQHLPTSGPDAVATNLWYHVAVTYTGYSPTNGDTAGVLCFYWTLLDPTRSTADLLYTTTNVGGGTIGGTPSPAVGGSQRTTHGIGNGGSFQGLITEVRVSDIAQSPTSMAFNTNIVGVPPSFTAEPPPSTFIGFGQTLTLNTLVSGTAPSYQWEQTNASQGGWTALTGQTNNALVISNAPFSAAGLYRLVASNNIEGFSYVTNSTIASVTIGALFSELENTGVDAIGVDTNLAGLPDEHYILHDSADINNLGPEALVWFMSDYPIAANGGLFANIDSGSQWIGSQANTGGAAYTSPVGNYVFRTQFLLDSVDTTKPAILQGTWWENSTGVNILINGLSTGNSGAIDPEIAAAFVITNGFVPGLNTLDFVTAMTNTSSAYEESALRVEMSGIGQALPAGLPTILVQPAPSQTVRDNSIVGVSEASFSVVAVGRPPLSYQWFTNGADGVLVPLTVPGATSRTLTFSAANGDAPTVGGQGTNFTVVVGNASGSVTSAVAVLTVVGTNLPPIAPNYTYYIYSNQTLNIDLSMLLNNASDPSGDTLALSAYDTVTTNESATTAGSLGPTGDVLSYTPNPGFLGADKFTYSVVDSLGDTTVGTVFIHVLPVSVPVVAAPAQSAGNLVMSGSGGAPNGAYTILGSASLLAPVSSWTAVATGNFDASGNFSVNLPINSAATGTFYVLEIP